LQEMIGRENARLAHLDTIRA